MRVLTPTLSPTLATESATVRLFFLSALLCSVNKAVCDFAHARPIMHCIHLVILQRNCHPRWFGACRLSSCVGREFSELPWALILSARWRPAVGRKTVCTAVELYSSYNIFIYYWGERERAPSCGLNGRAVTIEDIYIYIYGRHPLLRMRGATRKRSRPDRESIQSS